jgi:two-component system OmpR family response regulator
MRTLLIEDDEMLGTAVMQALQDAAYAVDWVRDGGVAEAALAAQDHALVLLDLGLPRRDGLQLLKTLRARGDARPVLILTARDALEDRIAGLDAGADDYLVKPFAVGELLARMRALMRRGSGEARTAVLRNDALSLELTTKRVTVDGQEVALSSREFALLRALMQRPGAVLSRAQLEQGIYGWGEEVESNAVDFLIHGLRRKLGAARIRNVRGMGWMVERPGTQG